MRHNRAIGIAGTAGRVLIGLLLVGSVLDGEVAGGFRPAAWLILNTLPVFGVAAAIAFLGERITGAQVAGAVVILIAFFLFEEGGDQAEDTQAPRPSSQTQHSPLPAIPSPALVTGADYRAA